MTLSTVFWPTARMQLKQRVLVSLKAFGRLRLEHWQALARESRNNGKRRGEEHARLQMAAYFKARNRASERLRTLNELKNDGFLAGNIYLSAAAVERGQLVDAENELTQVVQELRSRKDRQDLLVEAEYLLGSIARRNHQSERALRHLTRAIEASRATGTLCGRCLFMRGQVLHAALRAPDAERDFRLLTTGGTMPVSANGNLKRRARTYIDSCFGAEGAISPECESR